MALHNCCRNGLQPQVSPGLSRRGLRIKPTPLRRKTDSGDISVSGMGGRQTEHALRSTFPLRRGRRCGGGLVLSMPHTEGALCRRRWESYLTPSCWTACTPGEERKPNSALLDVAGPALSQVAVDAAPAQGTQGTQQKGGRHPAQCRACSLCPLPGLGQSS